MISNFERKRIKRHEKKIIKDVSYNLDLVWTAHKKKQFDGIINQQVICYNYDFGKRKSKISTTEELQGAVTRPRWRKYGKL